MAEEVGAHIKQMLQDSWILVHLLVVFLDCEVDNQLLFSHFVKTEVNGAYLVIEIEQQVCCQMVLFQFITLTLLLFNVLKNCLMVFFNYLNPYFANLLSHWQELV